MTAGHHQLGPGDRDDPADDVATPGGGWSDNTDDDWTGEPWEQLPGEPPRAHAAFIHYRDLGPGIRSLKEVARILGQDTLGQVGSWSSRWAWPRRAQQYDAYVDRQRVRAHIDEVVAMRARHAQVAMLAIGAMLQPLAALAQPRQFVTDAGILEERDRAQELREMDTAQLIGLADRGARVLAQLVGVERVARGIPADLPHEAGDDGPSDPTNAVTVPDDDARFAALFDAMADAGIDIATLIGDVVDADP